MTKKETLWRYVLHQTLTKKTRQFTQKDLAELFGVSLSTVFNALVVPRKISAVEVTGRYFRVRDPEKFLVLWASHRNFKRDIIYTTHVEGEVREIEGSLPPSVIFAAYSAVRLGHRAAPADYDKVYCYSDDLADIKKRFPHRSGYSNLFVLKEDPFLQKFGHTTPDVQTFVDLWNLEDWYAKDYLEVLKKHLRLV